MPDPILGQRVVEFASASQGEHPYRVPAIECKYLRPRIPKPLRRDESKRRRFAGASRTDDQGVAEIGDMEIETERCGSAGGSIQKRWAVLGHQGARIFAKTCPYGSGWHHVCEIQRVQQDTTNIRVTIAGQGTAPGFQCIHIFKAARETEVLYGFHDEPRTLVRSVLIIIKADDIGTVLAELNVSGSRNAHRLFGMEDRSIQVGLKKVSLPSAWNLRTWRAQLWATNVWFQTSFSRVFTRRGTNTGTTSATSPMLRFGVGQYGRRGTKRLAVGGNGSSALSIERSRISTVNFGNVRLIRVIMPGFTTSAFFSKQ